MLHRMHAGRSIVRRCPAQPRQRAALAALLALSTLTPGCGRWPWQASAASERPAPRAAAERLVAARQVGGYNAVSELCLPGAAEPVVRTLMAVDGFLAANAALCSYVRDHVSFGLAQMVDFSELGRNLDLFSRNVKIVSDTVHGDQASVAFMVNDELPLRRAAFRWFDGAWRYDPGDGYDPQLLEAFDRMARGLRLVLSDLESGRIDAQALWTDPEQLVEEVRLRLLPGVKLLPSP